MTRLFREAGVIPKGTYHWHIGAREFYFLASFDMRAKGGTAADEGSGY